MAPHFRGKNPDQFIKVKNLSANKTLSVKFREKSGFILMVKYGN
ncbi:hypothetical protein HMPREF1548_01954 [Clostridium sp. KLE 1755]|nr:hypothetical protein HMPREF1548_01954 [Clostridium sp. KLE 1755]